MIVLPNICHILLRLMNKTSPSPQCPPEHGPEHVIGSRNSPWLAKTSYRMPWISSLELWVLGFFTLHISGSNSENDTFMCSSYIHDHFLQLLSCYLLIKQWKRIDTDLIPIWCLFHHFFICYKCQIMYCHLNNLSLFTTEL